MKKKGNLFIETDSLIWHDGFESYTKAQDFLLLFREYVEMFVNYDTTVPYVWGGVKRDDGLWYVGLYLEKGK